MEELFVNKYQWITMDISASLKGNPCISHINRQGGGGKEILEPLVWSQARGWPLLHGKTVKGQEEN